MWHTFSFIRDKTQYSVTGEIKDKDFIVIGLHRLEEVVKGRKICIAVRDDLLTFEDDIREVVKRDVDIDVLEIEDNRDYLPF